MYDPLDKFSQNIEQLKELNALHSYLTNNINTPLSFDDILRSQLVYVVSAYDKFIHDIIRLGMLKIFESKRPATSKFLSENLNFEIHQKIMSASDAEKFNLYEQFIFSKLKHLSFIDPDKAADGLSLIWDEKFKWDQIALKLNMTSDKIKTTLKLIAARRNAIVHEYDIAPFSDERMSITDEDVNASIDIIVKCSGAIYTLIKV
jgi:hypothetical protein